MKYNGTSVTYSLFPNYEDDRKEVRDSLPFSFFLIIKSSPRDYKGNVGGGKIVELKWEVLSFEMSVR